jgi:hypothetical protein
MNTGHPRDVDPSITGQPHQVAGKVPGLMGTYRGRLVTRWTCQRRYEPSYRRNPFAPLVGAFSVRPPFDRRSPAPGAAGYAAPR